jgi:hypothetical protein
MLMLHLSMYELTLSYFIEVNRYKMQDADHMMRRQTPSFEHHTLEHWH